MQPIGESNFDALERLVESHNPSNTHDDVEMSDLSAIAEKVLKDAQEGSLSEKQLSALKPLSERITQNYKGVAELAKRLNAISQVAFQQPKSELNEDATVNSNDSIDFSGGGLMDILADLGLDFVDEPPLIKDLDVSILDNKFVAHVFGDASIGNSELEGSTIGDNVRRLQSLFKSQELLDPSLEKGYKQADQLLEKIHFVSGSYRAVTADQIAGKVDALAEGENLFLEGGWAGSGTLPGHACLYEFKKKEGGLYDVVIYNTGAGTEYHDSMTISEDGMQKRLICPFLEFRNVAKEALCLSASSEKGTTKKSFFDYLMKVMHDAPSTAPEKTLYQAFSSMNLNKAEETNPDFFITPQRSGTCSLRCVLAALKKELPLKTYKLIKLDLKIKVLTQFFEQEFKSVTPPIDSTKKELFLVAAKKLIRSISKAAEKGIITSEQKKELMEKILAMSSTVKDLQVVERANPTVISTLVKTPNVPSLTTSDITIPAAKNKSIEAIPMPLMENISIGALDGVIADIKKTPQDQQVLYIERLVDKISLNQDLSGMTKEELRSTMTNLSTLSSMYTKNPPSIRRPVLENTVWSLLALSFNVAKEIDPELAKKSIDYKKLEYINPLTPCFTKKELEKRNALLTYFKGQDNPQNEQDYPQNELLFDFANLTFFDTKGGSEAPYNSTIKTLERIANADDNAKKEMITIGRATGVGVKDLSETAKQRGALLQSPGKIFTSPGTLYIKELQRVAYAAYAYSNEKDFTEYKVVINWEDRYSEKSCQVGEKFSYSIPKSWLENEKQRGDEYSEAVRSLQKEEYRKDFGKSIFESKEMLGSRDRFAVDISAPTLQCQKIVYDYRNAMPSLSNPLAQEVFFCTLFSSESISSPLPIQGALQTENFKEQVSEFIKNGLDYFQSKSPDGRVNLAGCLFFVELIRRLEQIDLHSSLDLKPLLGDKINVWLASKDLKDSERQQLHLHRILAYASKSPLDEKALQEIMVSWLFLCHHPFENADSWDIFHQKEDCARFVNALMPNLKEKLTNSSLGSMLNEALFLLLKRDVKIESFDSSKFPLCSGLDSEKNVWQIDVVSGDVIRNNEVIKSESPDRFLVCNSSYKELFGKNLFSSARAGSTVEFVDNHGHPFRTWTVVIEAVENPYFPEQSKDEEEVLIIQMKVDGKWFEYVPNETAAKLYEAQIPSILLADTHVFTDGTKIIFLSKKDKQISFQWTEEGGLLDTNKESVARADQESIPAIEAFEEKKWHLYSNKKDGTVDVSLPRFSSLQGNKELRFTQEIKDGPFKWSGDPAFQLSSPSINSLGDCPNLLFLRDPKTGNEKILVPVKPIAKEDLYMPTGKLDVADRYRQNEYADAKGEYKASQVKVHTYLEYDINGKDPSPLNLEGTLYLSYIYLAQKKPQEALALLQELPKELVLTPFIKKILKYMYTLPEMSVSSSSSSKAVALRACLILLRDHEKEKPGTRYPKTEKEERTGIGMLEIAGSLLNSYKDGVNNVEGGLALSKEEIRELSELSKAGKTGLHLSCVNTIQEGKPFNKSDGYPDAVYLSLEPDFNLLCALKFREIAQYKTDMIVERSEFIKCYEKLTQSIQGNKERLNILADPKNGFCQTPFSKEEYTILTIVANWNELSPLFPTAVFPQKAKNGGIIFYSSPPFDQVSIDKIKAHLKKNQQVNASVPKAIIQNVGVTFPRVTMQTLLNRAQSVPSINESSSIQKCNQVAQEVIDTINKSPLELSQFVGEKFSSSLSSHKEVTLEFSSSSSGAVDAYSLAIEKEKRVIQESFVLGQDANRQAVIFSCKDGVTLESIKKDLKGKVDALQATIETQKTEILKLANKLPKDIDKATRVEEVQQGGFTKKVEFEALVTAFLNGTKESYLRINPHLTADEIKDLDEKITKILVDSNEASQGKRALALSSPDLIGKELSAKMEYGSAVEPADRVFLVFEYRADVRIRTKQIALIRRMLETNSQGVYKDCVSQLMMGGGKTSVLASILLQIAAKPGRIAFFVPPKSQFRTLATDLAQRQKKNFTCNIISMDYKRSDFTVDRLTWMKKQFEQAKQQREVILATPETLQALPLELQSLLNIPIKERTSGEVGKIKLLKFLVSEMKTSGDILIDEIDLILSAKNEMIFTKGVKNPIQDVEIDLVEEVLALHLDPDEMKIQSNEQGAYGKEKYQQTILPKIIERFFERHQDLLQHQDYILDPKAESLEGLTQEEKIKVEALKKVFLYLPGTLNKSAAQKYDRSPLGTGEAVIPYESRGNPTTREFGTTIECALYHFQTVLSQGVSENQLQLFAKHMADKALQVALVKDMVFLETPEAVKFKELTNCDLTVFGNNPSEDVIKKALEYVNSETSRKLEVEKDTISRVVGAFPGYFESDAQSFSAQFSSVRGFSGTPWNHAAYPEKLRDRLYLDQETEGKIIDQCLQKETKESVRIIQEPTINNLLQKISSNAAGLIDSSGMLKKLDTETAARQILVYHKDNVKIQTVLFFSKDGSLSALKKSPKGDPELVRIGSTQRAEIQKYDIDPESTFVYYDECHTEATDIFQSREAMNAILIDHKTTLRTCLQGILRLRNFFNKQSVEYVIADNEKHHFAEKEGVITVSHIMEKGVENQAKQIVQEAGKAYKQKIDCIFKEALFQLALKEEALKSYETFFVQTSDQTHPHNLEEYRAAQEEKFKILVKDPELQDVVSKQLDTLMEKIKSEACQTLTLEKEETQVEVEVEKETENTQEKETMVELQYQQELQGYQGNRNRDVFIERLWTADLFKPSIRSLHDVLEKIKYAHDYKKLFKQDIQVSSNFTYSVTAPSLMGDGLLLPIFAKEQKVAKQVLIRKVDDSLEAVIVSSQDAVHFKGLLDSDKAPSDMWLLLPDGTPYTEEAKPPIEKKKEIDRLLWQVNFFNGNISYLLKNKELSKEMISDNRDLRLHFLRLRIEKDPVQKALFLSDPLFKKVA